MSRRWLVFVGCLAVLVGTLMAASELAADPPAWTTFKAATFVDIYLTPALATNTLGYTLTIGPAPKVIYNSTTYDVNWVRAFFVVSQDQATDFTATNGSVVTDWMWEQKPVHGDQVEMAGWLGQGNDDLYPGDSKSFGFASFNIDGNAVVSGLHVGYGPGSDSEWFKDPLPVPEAPPQLLAGLGTGVIGPLSLLRRRLRRQRSAS